MLTDSFAVVIGDVGDAHAGAGMLEECCCLIIALLLQMRMGVHPDQIFTLGCAQVDCRSSICNIRSCALQQWAMQCAPRVGTPMWTPTESTFALQVPLNLTSRGPTQSSGLILNVSIQMSLHSIGAKSVVLPCTSLNPKSFFQPSRRRVV